MHCFGVVAESFLREALGVAECKKVNTDTARGVMNPASQGDFNPQNDSSEAVTPPNGGIWLQMNHLTLISQRG